MSLMKHGTILSLFCLQEDIISWVPINFDIEHDQG